MPDGGTARELNSGDQIGRYAIVRPLGRGGMGVVYVARDERLGRDVALKMIAGLADDTARSRFWHEARAAASVSHPNICQVFEVDESPNGIFLTMELLVNGYKSYRGYKVIKVVRNHLCNPYNTCNPCYLFSFSERV